MSRPISELDDGELDDELDAIERDIKAGAMLESIPEEPEFHDNGEKLIQTDKNQQQLGGYQIFLDEKKMDTQKKQEIVDSNPFNSNFGEEKKDKKEKREKKAYVFESFM